MILGTGEDTGANYQQMTMPASVFIESYHQFREIMGSRKYDLEYKENAFSALTYIYLNIKQDDSELQLCIDTFVAISEEFSRRKVMMLFDPEIY
jgi:hypothetical protein